MILPDGTVIPHYVGISDTSNLSQQPLDIQNNWMIRAGEVVGMYFPKDPGNLSKKHIEYAVNVYHRDGRGVATIVPYRCLLAEGMGGIADYLRFSLRPADKKAKNTTDSVMSNGARVLIACPNGDMSQAVIIGCLKHSQSGDPEERQRGQPGQDGGQFYQLHLNGVAIDINDDGELLLQTNGPTKIDGKPSDRVDENQEGSFIRLAKDGTITISNNRTEDEGESIVISTADKKITIKSETEEHQTTDAWTVEAQGDVSITTEGEATIEADGDARLDGSNIYLGSAQARENLVLGQKLVSALNDFVDIFLNNGANLGIGNLGAPVPLFPTIVTQLIAWKLQYTTPTPTPAILSSDKFTE
jgi:phage gp45-like